MVEARRRRTPAAAAVLLPSLAGTGLVHIAIFIGVHVVAFFGDAVAGVGVVCKSSCPAHRLAAIGVAGSSRRSALHHTSVLVVRSSPRTGCVVAGVGIACSPALTRIRLSGAGIVATNIRASAVVAGIGVVVLRVACIT